MEKSYTFMQYRLWSEMINDGIYKSMVDPSTTSMFKCCDGGQSTPDNKGSSVKEAVVDAVQQIAGAIVPKAICTSSPIQPKIV